MRLHWRRGQYATAGRSNESKSGSSRPPSATYGIGAISGDGPYGPCGPSDGVPGASILVGGIVFGMTGDNVIREKKQGYLQNDTNCKGFLNKILLIQSIVEKRKQKAEASVVR